MGEAFGTGNGYALHRQVDAHLHFIEELTAILESGIHYSIQRMDRTFLVKLGESVDEPLASASVRDIEQAVSWLTEQIKVHYPNSAYAKRLLTD